MAINELPQQSASSIPNPPGTGGGLPSLGARVWKVQAYSINHRRTNQGTQVTKQTTRHLTLWCDFVAEDFNDSGFAAIRNWEYLPASEILSVGAGNGNIEHFAVTANSWLVESLDVQIEGPKGVLTAQCIIVEDPVTETTVTP